MNIFADLSQYNIEKKIRTTDFSRTMLVSDKNTGQSKVMKTIFFVLNDESRQKRFTADFYKLMSLNFPTLLPYRNFSFDIKSNFNPSLILDYYKNGSLYDCCKLLTSTQKMIVLVGIVEGMRYLHCNNQYHGCLEPGNIIIDDNFHPLICSYGLADLSEKLNFDVFRSPFAFPNLINASDYDIRYYLKEDEEYQMKKADDVFAFAMLLYFVLTNETPLQRTCTNSQRRIEMFIRGFRPQLPNWVPSELVKLEYECWQPDAKKRPTFKEISHRLRMCNSILPPGIDISQVSSYLDSIGNPEEKKVIQSQHEHQEQNADKNINTNPDQNEKINNNLIQNPIEVESTDNARIIIDNLPDDQNMIQADSNDNGQIQNNFINDANIQTVDSNSSQDLNSNDASQNNNLKPRRIFLKFPDNPDNPEALQNPENTVINNASTPQKLSIDFSSSSEEFVNFSEKDNSESSEFINSDTEIKSKSKSKSSKKKQKSPNQPKTKSKSKAKSKTKSKQNIFSNSDSDSYFGSDFDSDSNTNSQTEEEPNKITENIKQTSPEMHENLKKQTKEGKYLIRNNGDVSQAVLMIRYAAEANYRGAILAYGKLFECGVGVGQDLKQAAFYYRRASAMGSNNAKAAYARFAMKGLGGVEHNWQAGFNLLEKAATAQFQKWQKLPNLKLPNENKNKKKLNKEGEMTTKQNEVFNSKTEAIYQYGKILRKKSKDENDPDLLNEALKFIQAAAEKDHNIKAMNLYGEILLELGKTKLYPKAAKFFKIAADEGNSKAQYNYGNCRKEGIGIAENSAEAVRYFKMSADQQNANGLNEYGNALQEGIGIERNVMKAKECIKLAADLGNTDAQFNYVMMLQLGVGIDMDNPLDKERADQEILEYLKKASDADYPEAIIMYSRMITKDLDKLSQNEKYNRLKSAKFYLKRILEISHDEGICAEAQAILDEVKRMIHK